MNRYVINRGIRFLVLGSLAIFLSACAAGFQTSGDIIQGRSALFAGNYQSALSLFQSAAQADPNSRAGTLLRQGILSYLGRAQYLNGQLEAARDTLRQDLAQQGTTNNRTLTQLYLGLTLARLGDRQAGLRDIESGTKGILDFGNYVQQNYKFDVGPSWDRSNEIRNAANANLATIAGGNFDWPMLISNSEALAMKFERMAYDNE